MYDNLAAYTENKGQISECNVCGNAYEDGDEVCVVCFNPVGQPKADVVIPTPEIQKPNIAQASIESN